MIFPSMTSARRIRLKIIRTSVDNVIRIYKWAGDLILDRWHSSSLHHV
jgi:hypothetical protein